MTERRRLVLATIVGVATLAVSLAPLLRGVEQISISEHHLLHRVIAAGAAVTGLIAAGLRAGRPGNVLWLLVAVLAPVAGMFMMWPSEYAFFETHPGGHALEHLGIVVLGFLSAFCGQRYAPGIGWAMALGFVTMAFLSAFGFGVSPVNA